MKYCVLAIVLSCIGLSQSVLTTMFYANSTTLNCPGTSPSWYLFNSTANSTTPISEGGKYSFALNGSLIIKDLRSSELNYCQFQCNGTGGSQTFVPNPAPFLSQANKKSITVTEGGAIELTCTLMVGFIYPTNTSYLTWSWVLTPDSSPSTNIVLVSGNQNGSFSVNSNYTISYNSSGINNVEKSYLVVRKVQSEMKGTIKCIATNAIDSHSLGTIIRVKGTLAALWPFLAIIAEVIILCIIILVFEKKCAKKETTNEDEAENLMSKGQKDTNNNKNSDLKQRSVKA